MAANTISQLTTANTFQHWLTATQSLIGTANLLTNGAGSTFYANTRLEIGGVDASLNVSNSASINVLYSNNITVGNINVTSNIVHANVTQALRVGTTARVYGTLTTEGDTDLLSNLRVGGYIAANSNVSVTGDASVGGNVAIAGNTTIGGDLTVTGNIVLDSIGFDDLQVAGSGTFGNTLSVTGATTVSTINAVSANISTNLTVQRTTTTDNLVVGNTATVTGSITANELLGNANTIIYQRISDGEATALAFSIALG
jgi:predicted acyltransferase (DUF342 family)